MSNTRRTTISSDLICSECGSKMIIPRNLNNRREKYHIKDIYCYKCKKTTKHIEVENLDIVKKKLQYKKDLSDIEKILYNLISDESENNSLCKK